MGKKDVKVKASKADAVKAVKKTEAATPAKKSGKKSKAVPQEEVESSESESEEEDSESEAESDSEDSDSSESESESEEEKEKPKVNGKTNGKVNGKVNGKTNGVKAEAKKEESDSDSSDSSDDEEDEDEKPAAKAEAKAEEKAESSDSDSGSDSDDSDDSSDDDEEKAETEEPSKKRKAEDEADAEEETETKKAKTEENAASTLFAGNLSFKVDDDYLLSEFKNCDGVVAARVITDRDSNRSKGYGYIDFENGDAAQAAFDKMQGYYLEGRELRLDFANQRPKNDGNGQANNRAKKYGDTISPESDTLFVGNLPFQADEDTVSNFFNEVSNVKSVRLPTDQESGRPKGFGYVSFYSVEDAKKAFDSLNGQDCAGRNVRLDYSSPRPPREGGGFGGGRGGGRGGFGGRGGGRGGFGGRGGGGGFGGRGGGGGRGGFGGRGGGSFQGKKTTF